MLRICTNCQSPFRPNQKVPSQKFCSKSQCQKERRKKWHRKKLQEDDDYKKNQANAQKTWTKKNPEYWKIYRAKHPEYVEKNKMQQTKRNQRYKVGRNCLPNGTDMIAKMDELILKSDLVSGYYMLYPVAVGKIAKMDEMLVRIEVISKS
jgi:hypothetical protein